MSCIVVIPSLVCKLFDISIPTSYVYLFTTLTKSLNATMILLELSTATAQKGMVTLCLGACMEAKLCKGQGEMNQRTSIAAESSYFSLKYIDIST